MPRITYDTMQDESLINAKSAARMLCVSIPYIYKLAREDKIPNVKLPGKVLFERQRIIEWVKEHSHG